MTKIIALCLCLLLLVGCTVPSATHSVSVTEQSVTATTATTTTMTTTTVASTTVPTTVKTLGSVENTVRARLQDSHVADIYRDSYQSIFGRLTENGFLQESLTGLYKGEYVRSIGAFAILADKVGETAAAGKALRFVTDVMQEKNLQYVPFTISADRATVRTEDELDGRAHFVLGWALYILKSKDTAYFDETYALMKREADAFCSDTYFYENVGLVRNRRFTHTRLYNGSDYVDVFDILTNSFVAAALEKMVAVAKQTGKDVDMVLWQSTLDKLQAGIRQNLTREVNGKTVYLEQLYFNGGNATPENGVSWVCLSAFASGYSGLDAQILQNTAAYTREKLWQRTQNGGYLAVECSASGTVKDWILGKSVGWDITAAAMAGDMFHINDTFSFLNSTHQGTIYMEKMKKNGDAWKTIDAGNAEQVIWFLYGIATLREQLGV